MSELSYNFQTYKSSYYDKLSYSYKLAFKKNFLNRKIYESRFNFKNKFTSIVLLNKNESEILAHIGFRIHVGNPKICRFIAFRFSTFIDHSLRGKGIYQEMMKYAENFLKTEFEVDIIYSWPNKINLISCLKDPKYKNLPPINTWQKEITCLNDFHSNIEQISIEELSKIDNQLTNDNLESLKKFFTNREDKKYLFFKDPKTKNDLILGKSEINNIIFFSILSCDLRSLPLTLDIIRGLGSKSQKNYLQLWCNFDDYENLRIILKNGFEPTGPIFNRGIYILDKKNISDIYAFPSMYHHDAF